MSRIGKGLLLTSVLFSSIAVASPVITVTGDESELSSKISLPLVGGGQLQQHHNYSGPAVPVGPMFEVEPLLTFDEDAPGDVHALWATSRFELNPSAGPGLELWSQVELAFDFNQVKDGLAWDSLVTPMAQSQSTLRWKFTVSETVVASINANVKGTAGYAAVRLVNKTTGAVLVSHASSDFGLVEFDSLVLEPRYEYHLSAIVREAALDDDDESVINVFFDQAVTFVSP